MEFLLEGIMSVTWQQILMYLVGIILIWLAIKKEYEPALLLPMGFGAILVNLPNTGVIIRYCPVSVTQTELLNGCFMWGSKHQKRFPSFCSSESEP